MEDASERCFSCPNIKVFDGSIATAGIRYTKLEESREEIERLPLKADRIAKDAFADMSQIYPYLKEKYPHLVRSEDTEDKWSPEDAREIIEILKDELEMIVQNSEALKTAFRDNCSGPREEALPRKIGSLLREKIEIVCQSPRSK